jgi:hypothetical protein
LIYCKIWGGLIVLLLSKEYLKVEKQENSGWETFISEKKKCRIYLLPTVNGSHCTFLTTKLVRAEIYLRNHLNESKSNIMELNKIFEKLNKKE